jgi:CBS domain-containing protein
MLGTSCALLGPTGRHNRHAWRRSCVFHETGRRVPASNGPESVRRTEEDQTMRKMADIVRNQDPVALPPNATVAQACRSMRDRRVGAVLVIEDDGRLVGIFTGRDAVHRVLAEEKSAADTKLAEVMTRDPEAMPPGKRAIEVLRLMEDGRYRHMPIVDNDKVVGIVSRYDFSGLELDRLDEETGLWERI